MGAETKRRVFFRWGLITLTIAFITAAPILVLTGCGQNPTNQQAYDFSDALDLLVNAEAARQGTGATGPSLAAGSGSGYDTCVSQNIGPSGGSLTMWVGGHEIVFNVPDKALDSNVVITICGWMDSQADGEVFVYDCEPSGLQFKRAMWVVHPVSVAGVDNSALFYKGGGEINWSFEDVKGVEGNAAVFEINHFSGYGVSNRRVGP